MKTNTQNQNQNLVTFVDNIIEEYKDGRIGSYLMLNYLNQIKQKAQESNQ